MMVEPVDPRRRLLLGGVGRLKLVLIISMTGFLLDRVTSEWIIGSSPGIFYEANTLLHPELGLPLLILYFIIIDQFLPRTTVFANLLHSLALMGWAAPVHNLLVFLRFFDGRARS
jgi:hypothetical protein